MGLSGVIMFVVWIFVALICIPISCFCGVVYVFCSLFEPCINPCSDLCELLMKGVCLVQTCAKKAVKAL